MRELYRGRNQLKKVASLELNKGLEGQLAYRFPQYFEQVDKSLLSVTECTRDYVVRQIKIHTAEVPGP